MTDWEYDGVPYTENIDEFIGFVYNIVNINTNRQYIGKKYFYSQKSKIVKGKKKRFKIESNWKEYYGSNEELLNDVKEYGSENFKRIILHLCESKAECTYLESKEQFERKVLESDDYYNGWIMCRVRQSHLRGYNERISRRNL